jgi:hypothetical protein
MTGSCQDAWQWLQVNGRVAGMIIWAAVRHPGKAGEIAVWSDGRVTYRSDHKYACACCAKVMTYKEIKPQLDLSRTGKPGITHTFYRCRECAGKNIPVPSFRP